MDTRNACDIAAGPADRDAYLTFRCLHVRGADVLSCLVQLPRAHLHGCAHLQYGGAFLWAGRVDTADVCFGVVLPESAPDWC